MHERMSDIIHCSLIVRLSAIQHRSSQSTVLSFYHNPISKQSCPIRRRNNLNQIALFQVLVLQNQRTKKVPISMMSRKLSCPFAPSIYLFHNCLILSRHSLSSWMAVLVVSIPLHPINYCSYARLQDETLFLHLHTMLTSPYRIHLFVASHTNPFSRRSIAFCKNRRIHAKTGIMPLSTLQVS